MSIMREKLNNAYREAAGEFADRIASVLGDQIDSIVLYGSVARGEATEDSDIDILIISPDAEKVRSKVSQIRGDFAYERNYDFFISLIDYTRDEFYRIKALGSPLIEKLTHDGVILYDNGIFSRVREEAARVR